MKPTTPLTFGKLLAASQAEKISVTRKTQGDAAGTEPNSMERRRLRDIEICGMIDDAGILPVRKSRHARHVEEYIRKNIPTTSLEQKIRSASLLEDRDAGKVRLMLLDPIVSAAGTVATAHKRGILHLCLAPDRIHEGENGSIYVTDWADAAHHPDASSGPLSEEQAARNAYIAPEQKISDQPLGPQCDVYALGAILAHVLTGNPPEASRVQGPNNLTDDIPDELASICQKAMASDPAERFADAGELYKELCAYRDGRLVRSFQYTYRQIAQRLYQRYRTTVWAGVAILTAFVISFVLVLHYAAVATRQRDRAKRIFSQTLRIADDSLGISWEQQDKNHRLHKEFIHGILPILIRLDTDPSPTPDLYNPLVQRVPALPALEGLVVIDHKGDIVGKSATLPRNDLAQEIFQHPDVKRHFEDDSHSDEVFTIELDRHRYFVNCRTIWRLDSELPPLILCSIWNMQAWLEHTVGDYVKHSQEGVNVVILNSDLVALYDTDPDAKRNITGLAFDEVLKRVRFPVNFAERIKSEREGISVARIVNPDTGPAHRILLWTSIRPVGGEPYLIFISRLYSEKKEQ